MAAALSEKDGFHTARGGDTLDAFAPLTHRGQKPQTVDQPAQWMKIVGAFTHYHGPDFHRVAVKEQDYVPEAANLLHTKLADPLK